MIDILKKNDLFANIMEADISSMLNCLGCHRKTAEKGELIFLAEQSQPALGILLSGNAQILNENVSGDSMIVGTLNAGDLFGETYACAGLETLPVSVMATEKCDVLLMDIARIINTCHSVCAYHQQLISNLLRILAEKNILLNQKMSFLSHKTIRGRLEAYFNSRMRQSGSSSFTIPLNLSRLADYLCVDRSAMSRELSRMKDERLLDYHGKNFHWYKKPE